MPLNRANLRYFHQMKHGSDAQITEFGAQITTSVPGNGAGGTCLLLL